MVETLSPQKERYQVIVIGASFAGNMLAAILARHGVKVALIEKGTHPKFTIGESTIPQTSAMMAVLAARYDVPELLNLHSFKRLSRVNTRCGIKRNFGFVYHRPGAPFDPEEYHQTTTNFGDDAEMHLFREDVDGYLLHVAVHYGCRFYESTAIEEVDIDERRVLVTTKKGDFEADYVVDGTGHESLLATKYGYREKPTRTKSQTRGIFTHMVDVPPFERLMGLERPDPGLTPFSQGTLHHIFDGGWMWVIPFDNHARSTNPLCSVGLMLDPRRWPKTDLEPEREFREFIAGYEGMTRQFKEIKAVRNWVSSGRIQYSSTRATGDRFCLMSHAAGFIDPLFSRGLCNTTETIYRLAGMLLDAAKDGDWSAARFAPLEILQRNLIDYNDRLVHCALIAFRDYRLWGAWLRIWTLASIFGTLRATRARLAWLATGDAAWLRSLEDDPIPGAIAAADPEVMAIFDRAAEAMEAVEAGTLGNEEAIRRIYDLLAEAECVPPLFPFHDPRRRVTQKGLRARLGLVRWAALEAPAVLKEKYFHPLGRRVRRELERDLRTPARVLA